MVVAAMVAVVTMMAMVAMVVVVMMIEQITEETSDETSGETQTWKHCHSPLSLGCPRLLHADAPGACRQGRLRQKQIRLSVICGTFDPVRHNSPASSAAARTPRPKLPSFSGNSVPSKARLRLTIWIEYGLRRALRMIARRADRPDATALGSRQGLRRRRIRHRVARDGRDAACCTKHRRPQALRLTGERPIAETGRWLRCPALKTLSGAGASPRWRSQRLPRSCRRGASHRRSAPSTNQASGAAAAELSKPRNAGVVSRSSRGIPAPCYPRPEGSAEPLR